MDWAEITARRDEKHLSFMRLTLEVWRGYVRIWCKFMRSIPAMLMTRTSFVSAGAPGAQSSPRAGSKIMTNVECYHKYDSLLYDRLMVQWIHGWIARSMNRVSEFHWSIERASGRAGERASERASEWVSVVGWLTDWVGDWLTTGWLITWQQADWLTHSQAGWLADSMDWLIDWLVDWLIDYWSLIIDYLSQP